MAWSWSHSADAYADAERNVQDLSREDLATILAEWHAYDVARENDPGAYEPFDEAAYADEYARLMDGPTSDVLADCVWELASELATCDNGGWNAWVCPYGCHTVPFSREHVNA